MVFGTHTLNAEIYYRSPQARVPDAWIQKNSRKPIQNIVDFRLVPRDRYANQHRDKFRKIKQ
jgi:hypothetical protein